MLYDFRKPPTLDPNHDFGLAAALEEGDWDGVAHIIEHYALELVTLTTNLPLTASALRALPPGEVEARPELTPHQQFFGLLPVNDELRLRPDPELPSSDREAARQIRAFMTAISAYRLHNRPDLAIELIEVTTPRVEVAASSIASAAESVAAAFFIHAANSYLRNEDIPCARRYLLRAWHFRHSDSLRIVAHETAAKLAALSAFTGNLDGAEYWIREASAWPSDCVDQVRVGVTFGGPLAEFVVAVSTLDLPRAERALPRLAPPTRGFEFYPWVAEAHVVYLLLLGHVNEATMVLEEAVALAGGHSFRPIGRAEIEVMLAVGRLDDALDRLDSIPEDDSSLIQRARALALREENLEAVGVLERLSTTAPRSLTLNARALRASCLLRSGDIAGARDEFAALLEIIHNNIATLTTIHPDVTRELLTLCRNHPEAAAVEAAWSARSRRGVYPFTHVDIQTDHLALSEREKVVLRHLASGRSRAKISEKEVVSINTVKTQIASIYRKLGVSTSGDAVRMGRELGVISGDLVLPQEGE